MAITQSFCKGSFSLFWWEVFSFQMDEILMRPKEIYLGALFIVKTRGKKWAQPWEGLLRVSMSCHFISETQKAWIAQTFPLIHVLSLDDDVTLSFRKPFSFPYAEITSPHLCDNFSLVKLKKITYWGVSEDLYAKTHRSLLFLSTPLLFSAYLKLTWKSGELNKRYQR